MVGYEYIAAWIHVLRGYLSCIHLETCLQIFGSILFYWIFPILLDLVGFTKTGIRADSMAARWVSRSAYKNRGRVEKNEIIARLQRVGVRGLGWIGTMVICSAGALTGSLCSRFLLRL